MFFFVFVFFVLALPACTIGELIFTVTHSKNYMVYANSVDPD